MEKYKIITTITEMGPYVSKIILQMPFEVSQTEISKESFNIYTERREMDTDEVVHAAMFGNGEEQIFKGYQIPRAVYPCSETGAPVKKSACVALDLNEEPLGKRCQGTVLTTRFVKNCYRITLLHAIDDDPLKSGLVFDECIEEICPQLTGWATVKYPEGDIRLNYGYYTPDANGKAPLIIWLHGAGEGGMDPNVVTHANKISHLSSPAVQAFYGGAAHILVPQCPTVWMDDGVEKLGKSNQSIYVKPLMDCIETFVSEHESTIDRNRIYVGGMSNGGFMTMRMIIDYPDYFAGALPACEVFYSHNITDEMLQSIKHIPIWFVHCKLDELVPSRETSLPTFFRLKEAGAENVHFTFYKELFDNTGRYRNEDGSPRRMFQHAVWNPILNNECCTDIDGTDVCVNGEPVTIWEWMAAQHK